MRATEAVMMCPGTLKLAAGVVVVGDESLGGVSGFPVLVGWGVTLL
jgi:hypothetical protein